MCLGQSGLGKSTFINSLFSAEINDPTPRAERSFSPTTQIEEKTVRLIENGWNMWNVNISTISRKKRRSNAQPLFRIDVSISVFILLHPRDMGNF
uniref:Septin-type G domain-containing protein n=1 Tax=Parascaris equorum TaxID=6256 RepID=A0A914RP05_PAREQ